MSLLSIVLLLLFSVFTGFFSGLVGIGGATFLIPFLVYAFGFDQKLAQGTSLLAFTLPSFIFGAITYYRNGNVKVEYSVLIFAGMLIGAFLGAMLAQKLDSKILARIFGITLFILGLKMFIDSFR